MIMMMLIDKLMKNHKPGQLGHYTVCNTYLNSNRASELNEKVERTEEGEQTTRGGKQEGD